MNFTKKLILFLALFLLITHSSMAMNQEDFVDSDSDPKRKAVAMLVNLEIDNDKFVRSHVNDSYFDTFINDQKPRMTLVMCVDSRVHHHAFDETPDNDIFTIRNLSGQYEANKGSILYGVNHLKTPLLVVMGHDDCGAVTVQTKLAWIHQTIKKASLEKDLSDLKVERDKLKIPVIDQNEKEETEKRIQAIESSINDKARELKLDKVNLLDLIKWSIELEKEIPEELKTIALARSSIPPTTSGNDFERFKQIVHQNIKFNTHYQVSECMKIFGDKVDRGELIIAGALYDFQGKEEHGKGRLIWIDARDKYNFKGFTKSPAVAVINPDTNALFTPSNTEEIPCDYNLYNNVDGYKYNNDQILYKVNKMVKFGVSRLKNMIELSLPYRISH